MILPDHNIPSAKIVADSICAYFTEQVDQFSDPKTREQFTIPVTVSIGVANIQTDRVSGKANELFGGKPDYTRDEHKQMLRIFGDELDKDL